MEIYIDDVRVDTDGRTSLSLNLAVARVAEPEKNRTGYTGIFTLPVTAAEGPGQLVLTCLLPD